MEAPLRCRSCGGPCPPGVELCPACRTDRLSPMDVADTGPHVGPGAGPALREISLPGLSEVPSAATPLCGRIDLLEQLGELGAESARQRRGRFCLVIGAPGAGKTRILGELERSLAAEGIRVLRGAADEGGPPLQPLLETLQQRFDLGPRDGAAAAREKLVAGCEALLPDARGRGAETAAMLADLLGLPEADRAEAPRPPRAAPPQGRLYQALRRLYQADAQTGPLALLLDEMEHAQPEAVNLLHYLAAGLSGAPVFLCAFARPEIDEVHPSFGRGEAPCDRIELPPLGEADAVHLLDSLCRDAGPAPPEVTDHVAQGLGGSPRAIEELVRMLEDTGALVLEPKEAARWNLRRLPAELPGSLEDIVAARLCAMDPPLRAVLEQAATGGDRFFLDAVVALGRATEVGLGAPPRPGEDDDGDEDEDRPPQGGHGADPDGPTLEEIVVAGDRTTQEVKAALRHLCRRGLLLPLQHSSLRGEREYRFAYPPWRDVVYDAMPPGRRRRYHALWAQWLDLSEGGEAQQEAIGNHLMRAGKGELAAGRYLRAAGAARERYAHGAATRLLARAIAAVGSGDLSLRIRLWHELGTIFHLRGAYEDALSAYEKVVRLSWVIASRSKAASALLHMGEIWQKKGELQLSLDYLNQALDLFQQAGDPGGTADVLDDIGQALWLIGRYDDALSRSAEALELRRRLGERGREKIAASLLTIGNIERHRGLLDAAGSCYEEALGISRALGDKAQAAACLNAIGMLSYQRGEHAGARRTWEEALALCEAVGAQPLLAVLQCHLGESLVQQGLLAEAEARFRQAERLARELSDKRLLSEAARALGLIALKRGDTKEAHGRCAEALHLAEEAGVRLDIGRALLGLGEVHAATLFDADSARRRGEDKALSYFRRANALLRELGNPQELQLGLLRQGRYQLECGEVQEGAQLLREAEALCAKLGIAPGPELRELLSEL